MDVGTLGNWVYEKLPEFPDLSEVAGYVGTNLPSLGVDVTGNDALSVAAVATSILIYQNRDALLEPLRKRRYAQPDYIRGKYAPDIRLVLDGLDEKVSKYESRLEVGPKDAAKSKAHPNVKALLKAENDLANISEIGLNDIKDIYALQELCHKLNGWMYPVIEGRGEGYAVKLIPLSYDLKSRYAGTQGSYSNFHRELLELDISKVDKSKIDELDQNAKSARYAAEVLGRQIPIAESQEKEVKAWLKDYCKEHPRIKVEIAPEGTSYKSLPLLSEEPSKESSKTDDLEQTVDTLKAELKSGTSTEEVPA